MESWARCWEQREELPKARTGIAREVTLGEPDMLAMQADPKSLFPDEQAGVTPRFIQMADTHRLLQPLLPEVKQKKTELTFKPLLWDEMTCNL